MRWQLLLVATCQRCDCNLCRLAAPLVMQRFHACPAAYQPACLCASSARNQSYASVAAKNEIDKENRKKSVENGAEKRKKKKE